MKRTSVFVALALVFCCVPWALMSGQDETTVKGLITARAADTLTLRTADGTQVVTLTDSTKVQTPKGLGLRKQQMSWTSLIPGLKVSVKGTPGADGKFEAAAVVTEGSTVDGAGVAAEAELLRSAKTTCRPPA